MMSNVTSGAGLSISQPPVTNRSIRTKSSPGQGIFAQRRGKVGVAHLMKPETLRLMNYYQTRFNNKVDNLITRSISTKGPYNSELKTHKPDTGESLTISRHTLGQAANQDQVVRESAGEAPNLASPTHGRQS